MRYLQRLGGVAIGAVLIMAAPVLAAPGDLDPSFGGGDGMKTNDFGGDDNGRGIVTLSNGKIVQVGDSDAGGDDDDFAIARYKPNGSRDTTFGGDGRVTTNFFDNHDTAWTVARYGNNKIVVAGWAENAAGDDFHFALARYRSGGGLDTTFGGDGRVVTPFPHEGYIYDILVLPNGSILAVGEDYEGLSDVDDFALAKYKPNGRLDRSFSGDGKRTTDFAGGTDGGWSVLRQGDRLLVSGWGQDGPEPNDYDVALARYRMNGRLDDSFSGDGKRLIDATPSDGDDYSVGMVPVENERIVILVHVEGDIGLVRINPGGSPDSTFGGGDGIVIRDFGGFETVRNVVRAGTKLVVGGEVDEEQAVWRFRQNGRKDLGFGSDGQAVSDYAVSASSSDITRRGDKVVVSGTTDADLAVSRFLLD
jgi:uncharacterized delta-60 repeat protein